MVKGNIPLTVKFRDKSEGTITSWAWDFNNDGRNETTDQNPSYIFSEPGIYTVTLTVIGPAGSDAEKKDGFITVRGTSDCDLAIGGTINPVNLGSAVFAKEPNTVRIFNVKNNGPGTSPVTTIELKASDGFSGRTSVPSLSSGGNTTILIVDTTVRSGAGQTIRYNATIDPDDDIGETNETNNVKLSADKVVTYNGYKGKRYWDGTDITTRKTFDLKGGLVQSFGNSVYRSGSFGGSGWTNFAVTWSSGRSTNTGKCHDKAGCPLCPLHLGQHQRDRDPIPEFQWRMQQPAGTGIMIRAISASMPIMSTDWSPTT